MHNVYSQYKIKWLWLPNVHINVLINAHVELLIYRRLYQNELNIH